MLLIILIALGVAFSGPAPAQAADRGSALQAPEEPPGPSQAYRSITLRMTKEEVRRLMGKPKQSTDTLWLYTYEDGTTVEVIFSKKRRVTQVVHYKKQRQFPSKGK
jgi:hypothetical protein